MAIDRPHMPVRAKLEACLLKLGLPLVDTEFDHDPPLAMRERYTDENGRTKYIPDANDPNHIVPRLKADHARKTNGKPHDKSDGDKHRIAKVNNRLKPGHEEFQRKMLLPDKGASKKTEKKKFNWPKRKMQNRK